MHHKSQIMQLTFGPDISLSLVVEALAASGLRIHAKVERDGSHRVVSSHLCGHPECTAAGTLSTGVRGDQPWYCDIHFEEHAHAC